MDKPNKRLAYISIFIGFYDLLYVLLRTIFNEKISGEDMLIFHGLSMIMHIIIGLWASGHAESLNRNKYLWGGMSFVLPFPFFFILAMQHKKQDVEETIFTEVINMIIPFRGKRCDFCGRNAAKVAAEENTGSLGDYYSANGFLCNKCGKRYCSKCIPRSEDGLFIFYCDCGGQLEP